MSSPFQDRLFRGYGPLIGFTALFLAVVLLVPSKAPEGVEASAGDSESILDQIGDEGEGSEEAGATEDTTVDTATTDTTAADGSTGSSGTGSKSTQKSGGKAGAAGAAGGLNEPPADPKAPAKVASCGAAQVQGDPYSPPCIQWSGGNGGDTARGVSASEITVAVRMDGFASGLVDEISSKAGAGKNLPRDTPERIQRTIEGLTEYFNKRFQFYGRKIKLVPYDGKGDILQEALDSGREGAQADALKVAQEYKAFADVSAVTPPYADALSSKQVVNIGVPYVSRDWLNAHKPHSWTQFTDCSTVVESVASYYSTKMAGRPATNAGGALANQPRRMATIAPSSENYQQCVRAGVALLEKAGTAGDLKAQYQYVLQVGSERDADLIAEKLKNDGITTILCGCDPLFLNYLTTRLSNQGLYPEFVVTGVALVDNDLVGQIMNQESWKHAFGVSFAGPTQAKGTGLGYRVYKSVRPDEPSIGVELIYNQLYLLAIGIQMAGPNLTVASFEKGMFDYPRKSGPYGTWGFGPGDYSTSDDAREVHWNPAAESVETRTKGAYIDSNGGARFPIGKWPGGNPKWAG